MSESIGEILPGQWLGLLGGGQLGRMFAIAAQSMGYRVAVLDPAEQSPAAAVADRHVRADYLDLKGLSEIAALCRAVTTEFENVPAQALAILATQCRVSPGAGAVVIAQDRAREKAFLRAAGIDTAPYAEIAGGKDIDSAAADLFPGILKASRLGYDGKGQMQVAGCAEAHVAFGQLGGVHCVLERRLALQCEVSVVVARNERGETGVHAVTENEHVGGVLAMSIVPARVSSAVAERARSTALRIAEELGYVGVLCVEFFVLPGDRVLVNEIAPRPHNSAHHTIEACMTSQFEQQVRVLAGLPVGSTVQRCPAVMLNLLGDIWSGGEPDWTQAIANPEVKLHLYGKRDARPGRKMGHITCLGATIDQAFATASAIRRDFGF